MKRTIRKEIRKKKEKKRLTCFIAIRLFRRRCGWRLFFTSTSFTRRTYNGLDRNSQIATAHRRRNNQTIRRVRRHGWRHRTGIRKLRNNMTRGLNLLRMKGVSASKVWN